MTYFHIDACFLYKIFPSKHVKTPGLSNGSVKHLPSIHASVSNLGSKSFIVVDRRMQNIYREKAKNHLTIDIAMDIDPPPEDLRGYDYDPQTPLPVSRDAREHVIAKGPCQPKDCEFPKDKNGRKFLLNWYQKFKWLEYSKKTDKAFCFYCRTFNRQVRNHRTNNQAFYIRGASCSFEKA